MAHYAELFESTWALVLVFLFFGGSIFIHEFGHFIAARLRGLRVLRFSIGFGPRLFSWTGKDGCKYMISLLPLGGYVALPQLADMGALEGEDEEDSKQIKNLPNATCSDKIIVSAAGAFFNLILAAVLASIVWAVGIPENAAYKTNVIGYVSEKITNIDGSETKSPAFESGLAAGDKILEIDSHPVRDFQQIIERIAIGSGRGNDGQPMADIKIDRNGEIKNIKIYPVLIKTNLSTGDAIRMIGISPALEMKVASIMENSPAQKAGLKAGDFVRKIDGKKLFSNSQLAAYLDSIPENKNVSLTLERDLKEITVDITPAKIAITKPVCEISGDGIALKLVCIDSDAQKNNPNGKDTGTVKVLSADSSLPSWSDIRAGDTLYQADGKEISSLSQIVSLFNGISDKTKIRFSFIDRDFTLKSAALPPDSSAKMLPPKMRTMLGYMLENISVTSHPNIAEQFSDSVSRTYQALASLFNPKSDIGIGSLAGPVDIGRVIYKLSMSHICLVLSFAVLLNVNLAILNMLPIPVLDGGHILIAIVSKLRGKPLPPTFFAGLQTVFSILFISLMAYVVWCGFMRWNGDSQLEARDEIQDSIYIKNIKF